MPGIPLSSGFDLNSGVPLELKTVKNTLADRDNIPTVQRYEGLEVYVLETKKFYALINGTSNSNWTERFSLSSLNGTSQYQLFVTGSSPYTPSWVNALNLVGPNGLNSLIYSSTGFVKMTGTNSFSLDTNQYALLFHTHIPSEVGLANVTDDAQLKRTPNDFTTFTTKSIPEDNDVILIEDSANGYSKKKTLWSNIKSTLKSYFDTLYSAISHTHTVNDLTGTLPISKGGTGVSTAGNNQIFTTNSSGSGIFRNLLGTTNQINVTFNTNDITLSLPQNIATTSSVIFDKVSISATSTSQYTKGISINNTSNTPALTYNYPIYNIYTNSITSNGSYYTTNFFAVDQTISDGITNSGYIISGQFYALRNNCIDSGTGTLNNLRGINISYGHSGVYTNNCKTNYAIGLYISPYRVSGTITNMYDIYLGVEATGSATVTNLYGIYQDNTKNNYFKGRMIFANTLYQNIQTAQSISNYSNVISLITTVSGSGTVSRDLSNSFKVEQSVGSDITNSAWITAVSAQAVRNSSIDGGTGVLNRISGLRSYYGHSNGFSTNSITNEAYGLYISRQIGSGTIGFTADIYLALDSTTGGTVTTEYGIYQSNTKNNKFNGQIIIENNLSTRASTTTNTITHIPIFTSSPNSSAQRIYVKTPVIFRKDLYKVQTYSGSSVTVDLSTITDAVITINGDTTVTFTNATDGLKGKILLDIVDTGVFTIVPPSGYASKIVYSGNVVNIYSSAVAGDKILCEYVFIGGYLIINFIGKLY